VTRSSDNALNIDGTPNKKSSLGSSFITGGGGGVKSGLPMEVDEMDADADEDAEAEAELESEAEAEILGAVAATSRNGTDEEGGDDGEGEADADADAELLEAVDAAEANSSSSHGGEREVRVLMSERRRFTDIWLLLLPPSLIRPSDMELEIVFTVFSLSFNLARFKQFFLLSRSALGLSVYQEYFNFVHTYPR
jgi:hypothetical protein